MNKNYSDENINIFLELAQEVGFTKAKRELGYPSSWATAQRWAQVRGIEVPVDELMSKAASTREFYKEEEVKTLIQEGFNRVYEELVNTPSLTADDQKKLSDAASKYYTMWANVQGKANQITETRTTDDFDAHFNELLNIEKAKNSLVNKTIEVKEDSSTTNM